MAKRKVQHLKQKIATVGDNSTKFTRRMEALAEKYYKANGVYPQGFVPRELK